MTKVVQADRKNKTCFEFFKALPTFKLCVAQIKIGVSREKSKSCFVFFRGMH